MKRRLARVHVLRVSAICALVALSLILWALLDSRPIAMVISMSVGQALGTMSLIAFLIVVVTDLRRPPPGGGA